VAELTVFHNPGCSTSKHALATLDDLGVEHDVVQYLKHPPDRATLEHLLEILEDPPGDLVRKDPYFTQLGLDPDAYTTPAAVVDLLLEHPRLMQRPVLVRGDRAIIGRPKDRVAEFVSG
jgi:arsenate reductase (glutaredoxin)